MKLSWMARRFAWRWCSSKEEACDIAQEALVGLLAQKPRIHSHTAWLFVVTRRLACRDHYADHSRCRSASSATPALEARTDPGSQYAYVLVHKLLRDTRLSARDKRVLSWIASGYTHAEIATYLGCTRRNVGQYVARARKRAMRLAGGSAWSESR